MASGRGERLRFGVRKSTFLWCVNFATGTGWEQLQIEIVVS